MRRVYLILLVGAATFCLGATKAVASVVILFNAGAATDTYNGGLALTAAKAVDAVYTGASRGWAISGGTGANSIASQAAVFPLSSPLEMVYPVTFGFVFNDPTGAATKHILGRFELYATTAEAPTAASDENIWTLLTPTVANFSSAGGMQFNVDGGTVTYSSGAVPDFDSYSVTVGAVNLVRPVTAFRLKALADENYPLVGPSLPSAGPGLASNGNFLLSELVATGGSHKVTADIATFIRSDQGNTNHDSTAYLLSGSASSGSPRIRTLLGFDMSILADNPVFNRVELDLTVERLDGGVGSVLRGSKWELYGVTEYTVNNLFFTEDQVTWNSRATGIAWSTPGGDFDAPLLASVTLDWEPIVGDAITLVGTGALTSAVSSAIADDKTLYFMLMQGGEGTNSARRFLFLHTEDSGTLAQAPTLRLTQIPEPSALFLLFVLVVCGTVSGRRMRP